MKKDSEILSNIFTFKDIMSIPIESVIDANIAASKAILKFIMDFGFEKVSKEAKNAHVRKVGKPKMLSFVYDYINDGVQQRMKIEIPVLTMIPLPLLTIEKAKFDVGLKVINYSQNITSKNESEDDTEHPALRTTYLMLADLDKKALKKSNGQEIAVQKKSMINMEASINVKTSDMPNGLMQMLNVFQKATQGSSNDRFKINTNKKKLLFKKNNKSEHLELTLTDSIGKVQENEFVSIQILSNEGTNLSKVFANDIKLIKGDPIGKSSFNTVQGLTNNDGVLSIRLTCNSRVEDNGYLKIRSELTDDQFLYYKIQTK